MVSELLASRSQCASQLTFSVDGNSLFVVPKEGQVVPGFPNSTYFEGFSRFGISTSASIGAFYRITTSHSTICGLLAALI
jgi:hypothetical protein